MINTTQDQGWWLSPDGEWISAEGSNLPPPGWWRASDGNWYSPEQQPASTPTIAPPPADFHFDPADGQWHPPSAQEVAAERAATKRSVREAREAARVEKEVERARIASEKAEAEEVAKRTKAAEKAARARAIAEKKYALAQKKAAKKTTAAVPSSVPSPPAPSLPPPTLGQEPIPPARSLDPATVAYLGLGVAVDPAPPPAPNLPELPPAPVQRRYVPAPVDRSSRLHAASYADPKRQAKHEARVAKYDAKHGPRDAARRAKEEAKKADESAKVLAYMKAHDGRVPPKPTFSESMARSGKACHAEMICPHCQTKGTVWVGRHNRPQGVSGAKLAGGVLTGGVSFLATGFARYEKVSEAYCENCKVKWTL